MTLETTLATIELAAKAYASDRAELCSEVQLLEDQILALKRAALTKIKKRVAKAAETQTTLTNLIDGNRNLFIKPRALVFHGIKCGLRKGSGGVDWEDDARVVELIRKHFPKAQAELLIKTTEKPIAKAIADLDVAELKKIGCTIEDTSDLVVVKPVDDGVDKLVNALLTNAIDESTANTD